VTEVNIAPSEPEGPSNEEHRVTQNPGARFTPGQFFKEAGILIAVCLGLGLLAQVLVPMLGTQ